MLRKFSGKLKIFFIPVEENGYRPKFLESRVLLGVLTVLLVLKIASVPFFLFFPKNVFFASIIESALIKLVNQDRQSLGRQSLKENLQLKQAALLKAKDMLEHGYFAHESPQGISPWYWFKLVGYNYGIAGENLAIGFLDSEQVHSAWTASPSHRANILNPSFREIGVAVLRGNFQGNETTVVVQLFGAPALGRTEVLEPPSHPAQTTTQPPAAEPPRNQPPVSETRFAETPIVESMTRESLEAVAPVQEQRGELMFGFLSFISSDLYRFLRILSYGLLIFIILCLLLTVFIRIDVQHPDLIFKTIFFMGLLILFVFVDKVDIVQLISRNFAIY